jgi:predicted metalloprotease with PDZ domain
LGTIRYALSLNNPSAHYLDVEILADNLEESSIKVVIPVWAPGSYLVREFSRNVQKFKAFGKGKPLRVSKLAKNIWKVETKGNACRITYRVYAFEMGVQTSYFDEERATVNGPSVFCCIDGREDENVKLEIRPYRKFKKISTGLERQGNVFVAENYDQLIDSPVEIGNQQVYSFAVDGKQHEVSIYGSGNLDPKKFIADIKKIVKAAGTVFGEYPYQRYVFIIHLVSERGGGLEHRNSSMIKLQRWSFKSRTDYLQQLSLVAHEFFHLWNVKRLRPKHLVNYDYQKENYTELLWVSEGLTSYYENEILRRAKIYSAEEFLEALLNDIELVEGMPGRRVQSVEEASYDAWIKHYRQDENTPNSSVSYYAKGAIIGWMLDMEVKRRTNNGKSLDDVMRLLYRETYKQGRGFDGENFQKACKKVCGSLGSFFADYVGGVKDIDYNTWLGYAGLSLKPSKRQGGFLGVKLKGEGGKFYVANVMQNGPAQKAGIYANDEIISFNGFRVNEKLQERLAETKPNSTMPMIVSRDERVISLDIRIGEYPNLQFTFEKIKKPTRQQKQFFERWLRRRWEEPMKFKQRETAQERRWI